MCLVNKYTNLKKQSITDKIDKDGLKVYKMVARQKTNKKDYPLFSVINNITKREAYEKGVNIADASETIGRDGYKYKAGFHFYKDEKAAEKIMEYIINHRDLIPNNYEGKVVTCIVKKTWITSIGEEGSPISIEKDVVIVAKKAIFP